MRLQDIDKDLYRSRLRATSAGFIFAFAVLSVIFGSLLIMLLSDGQGSNFKYNLSGVVLGLVASIVIFSGVKEKPYFKEIFYVWSLKKSLMPIYNKLARIRQAAFDGDITALLIYKYYQTASKQIYLLDDNTLTLSDTEKALQEILDYEQNHQLQIDINEYQSKMLISY